MDARGKLVELLQVDLSGSDGYEPELIADYLIANGVTVQEWIPVTERLPDEHESLFAHYKGTDKWCDGMFMTISDLVIVCAEYENGERIVKTANTTEGIWKVKDSFYPCRVTHWMPLPEPPEKAINQDHNQGKENDYGNQSE